jgi:hypothetical protein
MMLFIERLRGAAKGEEIVRNEAGEDQVKNFFGEGLHAENVG